MKIVVVSINYDPEMISTGVYSTGLADFLASRGHEVKVVCALPYYPEWRTFEGWRRPFWKARKGQTGTRITHCPIYVPAKPTGLRRIIHYISFALTSAPIALWHGIVGRPDAVFVVAPSLVSAPIGWAAARLGGAKAWLHIQDFEVEAAFATGLLPEKGAVANAAKGFERWILKRFDTVSSISRPMIDKVREKGVADDRVFELRNWANLAKVKPVQGPSPLKAELGIETEFVALYSGNLANKQGLEILPEMARLLRHRSDLTIAICGEGPMRDPLVEMSKDCDNVRFFPLQPIDRLSDLLGMADVHLLPQIAGAADLVLPSKLTNMLASGRPTIATTPDQSALAEEVSGAGVIVPPGDAGAIAKELEALLDEPARRSELGQKARERALDRWDMGAILGRFESQLLNLTSEPEGAEENLRQREKY